MAARPSTHGQLAIGNRQAIKQKRENKEAGTKGEGKREEK